MAFRIYNSLGREKEEFKPLNKKEVLIYNCGPTVYGYAHIGNLRRFLVADLLRRYLEFKGYTVKQVTNITDVGHLTQDDIDQGEDKVLKKAKEEKKTPEEIAKFYEEKFFEDLNKLNIKVDKPRKDHYPRATENIKEMQEMIKGLLEKEYAYETSKGIYFDITKADSYGKLSGNTVEALSAGERVEVDTEKRNPADFTLWVKADKDHLMQWDSPWGSGYPGWHIECSAMAIKYLDKKIDIHTGGVDNKFPHHENEIAQGESYLGEKNVNYWMHNGHLKVNDEKMAKSKGNFYTLKDIEEKGYSPMVFRMLVMSSHYRSKLDFSWAAMDQAKENLETFKRLQQRLQETEGEKEISEIAGLEKELEEAMDDDLDIPRMLATMMKAVTLINTKLDEGGYDPKGAAALLEKFYEILGLTSEKGIDGAVKQLLEERNKAREEEDYEKSDQLREELKKKGYEVDDTKEGTRLIKI